MTLFLSMLLVSGANIHAGSEEGAALAKLRSRFGLKADDLSIVVEVSSQRLYLFKGEERIAVYPVSTSKYGVGNRENSNRTPLGTHRIKSKHGKGAALGTIFVARKSTGKVAKVYTDKTDSQEDLITSRIFWLEGLERGINKGRGIDSYKRYIYIHGTPEEGLIGEPASHGCVRMRNEDVIELFERVPVGTLVEIQ